MGSRVNARSCWRRVGEARQGRDKSVSGYAHQACRPLTPEGGSPFPGGVEQTAAGSRKEGDSILKAGRSRVLGRG
jgi:hypothetical protein